MAEQRASGKAKPTSAIAALSLTGIDLAFNPELEDSPEVELSYNVEVTVPKKAEDQIFVFTTEVMIAKGRKGAEGAETAVSASYFCGIQCEHMKQAEIIKAAQNYARTTIWSNFISLAAVITHQMRSTFPAIPPMPGRVTVIDKLTADVSQGE